MGRAEVPRPEDGARVGQSDGAREDVLELAHVARPRVRGQRVEGRGGHLGVAPPEVVKQSLDEIRNLLDPLPQRRHLNHDDCKAEVEVLPERARGDARAEIAVRGGDHADVHRAIDAASHAPHDATVERTQQPRLQLERQLSYLVEKERAALRALEGSRMHGDRAGERTLLVTEQLALGETRRHRAAIEHHERPARSRAVRVERVCKDVLARSRLAEERHRRVGPRGACEQVEDRVHLLRARHDPSVAANLHRAALWRRGQRRRAHAWLRPHRQVRRRLGRRRDRPDLAGCGACSLRGRSRACGGGHGNRT